MSENRLKEVAAVFFKMGCLAFGGPAVHIAMMEDEVVEKRKWLPREEFLDLIGGTNLIPGPNSTEMTMHCGYVRAGRTGLFVAGLSFILPAILITGILAWAYVEYGQLPHVVPFVAGIKPAVLAVIASAILKLGKKALKGWELGVIGGLVAIACLMGQNEIIALLSAGVMGAIYFSLKSKWGNSPASFAPILLASALPKISTTGVFLSFLKVGAILYGSGYVLFAYLDAELVSKGIMSQQELLDAIAIGQFTPGPVLSTATFVGYQLTGVYGAIAASAGIFLPSFLFVLLLHPLVPKMRKSKFWGYFLNSVNVAAVAVMLAVLIDMGKAAVVDWQSAVLALISVGVVFGIKKVSPMWVILGGAGLGYLLNLV